VPKAEIEGSMGDSHVGLQARLMSQALRKLNGVLSDTKTTAVFINQLREKIGVYFGNPETTTGGKALKFYASIRLDVRPIETLEDGGIKVGRKIRVKVPKNKVARPFGIAELDLLWGWGFSREGELLTLGKERGVLTASGSHYSYGDLKLGNGREVARRFLAEDPETAAVIEKAVRAAPPALPSVRPRHVLAAGTGPAPWEEGAAQVPS
jgi:recombination protein RecA